MLGRKPVAGQEGVSLMPSRLKKNGGDGVSSCAFSICAICFDDHSCDLRSDHCFDDRSRDRGDDDCGFVDDHESFTPLTGLV